MHYNIREIILYNPDIMKTVGSNLRRKIRRTFNDK